MMKRLRVERLAGVEAGQACLAAAALGAGEAVEQVLPAEVLEGLEPNVRRLVLDVELGQLAARRELAEPDVREARRDVEVLRERQVAQERRDQRDVRPPQDAKPARGLPARASPQGPASAARRRRRAGRRSAANSKTSREQLGRDHPPSSDDSSASRLNVRRPALVTQRR
jgi:hypothetical protein